jgi:hypothetical protein
VPTALHTHMMVQPFSFCKSTVDLQLIVDKARGLGTVYHPTAEIVQAFRCERHRRGPSSMNCPTSPTG